MLWNAVGMKSLSFITWVINYYKEKCRKKNHPKLRIDLLGGLKLIPPRNSSSVNDDKVRGMCLYIITVISEAHYTFTTTVCFLQLYYISVNIYIWRFVHGIMWWGYWTYYIVHYIMCLQYIRLSPLSLNNCCVNYF